MKAVRWHDRGDVRVDDVPPPPPPSADELQVAVTWCGICGTDVEEWLRGPVFIPVTPNPITGACAPLTLGHEFVGVVAAVGDGIEHIQLGDRIAVDGLMGCGDCLSCSRDRVMLCPDLAAVGLMADGGLAELVNVRADVCEVVPKDVPDEDAALAETLAVGVRALHQAELQAGERVVVIGAGAVGLLTAQAAVAMQASEVVVVEPVASRRRIAAGLGLSTASDIGQVVDQGEVVVECSGRSAVIPSSLETAVAGGRVVLVGIYRDPVDVDFHRVVGRELAVIGSLSHHRQRDFRKALDLLASGRVKVSPLISDRIPLEDAIDRGLHALADAPTDHLKILVHPSSKARP